MHILNTFAFSYYTIEDNKRLWEMSALSCLIMCDSKSWSIFNSLCHESLRPRYSTIAWQEKTPRAGTRLITECLKEKIKRQNQLACSYSVCPITLPIFVDMSSRERFTATTTTVSHLDLVPPRLDDDEWLRGPSTSVSDELSMTFSSRRSGLSIFLPPETQCPVHIN